MVTLQHITFQNATASVQTYLKQMIRRRDGADGLERLVGRMAVLTRTISIRGRAFHSKRT